MEPTHSCPGDSRPRLFTWLPALALAVLALTVSFPARAADPSPAEISATGSISSHFITKGEKLHFTINLRNKTVFTLSSLKLAAAPDDYDFGSVTVFSTQTGKNLFEPLDTTSDVLVSSLPPGQNITISGYLLPKDAHKAAALSVTLLWSLPANTAAPTSIPVSLGDNQVRNWYEAQWLADLTKILAVPLLLAIITALVTYSLNLLAHYKEQREEERRRQLENAKKDAEEAKERKAAEAERAAEIRREEADRIASIRAETWKQMLPVSHNYAAKFYLPLSLAAERLVDSLEKKNHELAFFYLLLSGKKMIATRNEIGGFYFKDLRGETLAAQCWKKQRLACLGEEDTPFFLAVRQSIGQLEEIDSYDAFVEAFIGHPGGVLQFSDDSMQEAWRLFEAWVAKPEDVHKTICYLQGFYAILDFESNRPYEYWYDTTPRMVADDPTEKLLRQILQDEKYTMKEINDYFARVSRPN